MTEPNKLSRIADIAHRKCLEFDEQRGIESSRNISIMFACIRDVFREAAEEQPYKPTELPGYYITEIIECRDCHTNKWYKANDTDMAYCIQCRENRTKTTDK